MSDQASNENVGNIGNTNLPTSTLDNIDIDMSTDDEYDFDIPYNEELESALQAAESQSLPLVIQSKSDSIQENQNGLSEHIISNNENTIDIEDLPIPSEIIERLSPFQQFRKKGYLSVSDLVGPIWCETQYDYRLRTLPYLPPSQRPDKIKSKEGNEIVVNKVKVEDKEKILRRGEKIHKRLEREIHPEEIKVPISTEEDIWGLRFLNMLAAMEALLVLGKCRELPVVGFIKGVLIYGVIDEIVREPIPSTSTSASESTPEKQSQTSLKSFFTSSRPKSKSTSDNKPKTHRLFISDSKTRASNVLPKEEDTLSGRLQVMLYKELLDSILLSATTSSSSFPSSPSFNGSNASTSSSILPSRNPFSWDFIFTHLGLNPNQEFSSGFLEQSKLVVIGNGLRFNTENAKNLNDFKLIWNKYILELGLGVTSSSIADSSYKSKSKGKGKEKEKIEEDNIGKTEDLLKLVYRRAGGKKKSKKERKGRNTKRRRRGTKSKEGKVGGDEEEEEPPPSSLFLPNVDDINNSVEEEENRSILLAIQESLRSNSDPPHITPNNEEADTNLVEENNENAVETIPRPPTRTSEQIYWGTDEDEEDEKQEDELAWAVELSLNPNLEGINGENVEVKLLEDGQGVVNVLNKTPVSSQQSNLISNGSESSEEIQKSQRTSNSKGKKKSIKSSSSPKVANQSVRDQVQEDDDDDNLPSGTIIGTHKFTHSPLLLAKHLENVFQFWMGEREPIGVNLEETRRCGWCEFEEGCEWRLKKAEEIWKSRKIS